MVLAATLVVYYRRHELLPGYGAVGTDRDRRDPGRRRLGGDALAGAGALAAALPAPDPATAGTLGFLVRLLAITAVVILRCASPASTPPPSRSAAPSPRSSSASPPSRPSAGSSPASSCRAPGPSGSANGCGWSAAPSPARSRAPSAPSASSTRPSSRGRPPAGPQQRPHQPRRRAPSRARQSRRPRPLLHRRQPAAHRGAPARAITVPTRYQPNVSLEEMDDDGVVLRVNATPLRPEDGSQLAEEMLEAPAATYLRGLACAGPAVTSR